MIFLMLLIICTSCSKVVETPQKMLLSRRYSNQKQDAIKKSVYLNINNGDSPLTHGLTPQKKRVRSCCSIKMCYTCTAYLSGCITAITVGKLLQWAYHFPHVLHRHTGSVPRTFLLWKEQARLGSYLILSKNDSQAMNIPAIVHQMGPPEEILREKKPVWYNNLQKWRAAVILNPKYIHIYWTDDKLEKLVKEEYPKYYQLYKGYHRDIQRYDSARYFILHKYGGIYIDLDIYPRRPETLKKFNNWDEDKLLHHCTSILIRGMLDSSTIDLMLAEKNSLFMDFMISQLEDNNRNWIFPSLTVLASTGPIFSTEMFDSWEEFRKLVDSSLKPICSPDQPQFYIGHTEGNSWHEWDTQFGKWLYAHNSIVLAIISPIILGFVIMIGCYSLKGGHVIKYFQVSIPLDCPYKKRPRIQKNED